MELCDIEIYKVEPADMRYDTIGDWFYDTSKGETVLVIKHIDLKEDRYNYLLVHHEIAEAMLCGFMGVTDQEVTNWDIANELAGDDMAAPYHKAHTTAEASERVLALALHVNWGAYVDTCERAFTRVQKERRQKP